MQEINAQKALNLDKHFLPSVLQSQADESTVSTSNHATAAAATEEAVPEAAGKHASALAATAGDPLLHRAAEGIHGQQAGNDGQHAGSNQQPSDNSGQRHQHRRQQAGGSGQQAKINGQQTQDSGQRADTSRQQNSKKGQQIGCSRQRHSCSGQQPRNSTQQAEGGGQQTGNCGQQCQSNGQQAGPSSMVASMATSADGAAVTMAGTEPDPATAAVTAKSACLTPYKVVGMAAREVELDCAKAAVVSTAIPTSSNSAPNSKAIATIAPPQASVDNTVDGDVDSTVGEVVEESSQLADDEATFRAVTGTECIAYGAVRYEAAIAEVLAQEAGPAQVVDRSVKLAVGIAAARAVVVAGLKVVYQDTEAVLEKAQVHLLVCVILAKEAC